MTKAASFEESPCLVQDTLMNAVLIKSNQSLIKIGKQFGLDTGELEEWQQQSKRRFKEKFWNPDLQTFTPYDLRGNHPISQREIGAMVALYAEIATPHQAHKIDTYLCSLHARNFYICPSFDVDSSLFDSKRYWRGPIWPQMNWMLFHGLKHYGFEQTAQIVKSDLLELVSRSGFYEYFESQKNLVKNNSKGYGGDNFSWTAACVLDLQENA